MPEPPSLTVRRLRAALKSWDDAPALGTHELCDWKVCSARRAEAGYEDTPAGRGLALRALLEEAIHDLRPAAGEPQPADPAWREYLILQGRYIDGRSPDYLAEMLAVARSTYNHAQLGAENALLARLLEWEERAPREGATGRSIGQRPAAAEKPFMAPPRRPKGLTGRADLYGMLREKLVGQAGARLALWGLPGVGKTALAVELAHDPIVRAAYPDGVLWVGLGARPDRAVLQHLLASALGLPHELVAGFDRFEDRARLIQQAIASRQMLVVLDDAWHAPDALAFQLGGAGCGHIVTTRAPGLVQSLPEYEPVEVPELSLEASLALLEHYAPKVVRARREMLGEAIARIGGLPLTMVLVGGFLRREAYAGQPRRLAEAIGRLRQAENWGRVESRVSPLEGRTGSEGEADVSLFAVIAMSEGELKKAARIALHALASFPPAPADFSEELALGVVGGTSETLDELVDAGLLEPVGSDRYRMHGAIAHYLASQGGDVEREKVFVRAALAWMDAHASDPFGFENEAATIQTAVEISVREDMPRERGELAHLYFQYLKRAGLMRQALGMLTEAYEAIHAGDHRPLLLKLSLDCGQAHQQTGDFGAAQAYFARARDLAQELGDQDSLSAALQGLGSAAYSQGDLQAAGAYYQEGLNIAEATGLVNRQAGFLSNLGTLAVSEGDPQVARQHFEAGLALARAADDTAMSMALLSNLGTVHASAGEWDAAARFFDEALGLAKVRGDRLAMSTLLANLGTLAHEQGDDDLAQSLLVEALELARENADRARTSQLLANLGAMKTAAGDYEQAEEYLKEGLTIAEGIGHREHGILLRINLAELAFARLDPAAGKDLLQKAEQEAASIQHKRYQAIISRMLAGRKAASLHDVGKGEVGE